MELPPSRKTTGETKTAKVQLNVDRSLHARSAPGQPRSPSEPPTTSFVASSASSGRYIGLLPASCIADTFCTVNILLQLFLVLMQWHLCLVSKGGFTGPLNNYVRLESLETSCQAQWWQAQRSCLCIQVTLPPVTTCNHLKKERFASDQGLKISSVYAWLQHLFFCLSNVSDFFPCFGFDTDAQPACLPVQWWEVSVSSILNGKLRSRRQYRMFCIKYINAIHFFVRLRRLITLYFARI